GGIEAVVELHLAQRQALFLDARVDRADGVALDHALLLAPRRDLGLVALVEAPDLLGRVRDGLAVDPEGARLAVEAAPGEALDQDGPGRALLARHLEVAHRMEVLARQLEVARAQEAPERAPAARAHELLGRRAPRRIDGLER